MSFLDDESGIQSSEPREFYEIIQSLAVTYRIASGVRDVVYDGKTYTAAPAARTEIAAPMIGDTDDGLTLALPLSHGLVQRYLAQVSPPRQITVTIYRMQASGDVEQLRSALITSMAIDGHLAKFLIPSRMSRALSRPMPGITVGLICPHILYDAQCQIDPTAFTVTTTVSLVDGRTVTVPTNALFGDENFAYLGDFKHVATGETQTIFAETPINIDGTVTFQLQSPIPGMVIGDSVQIRAGCQHDVATCHDKFANMVNYGGFPNLPSNNIFTPGAFGVRTL